MNGIYRHSIHMSVERREIIEEHEDHVVVLEWLKPDPKGMYLVMSDHEIPAWAARRFEEPKRRPLGERA